MNIPARQIGWSTEEILLWQIAKSLSTLTFQSGGGGGTGTVSEFIFTNVNGFTGNVSTSTTIPTLSLILQDASTSQSGQLNAIDWNTFNGKQDSLVSGTNIKTLNSVSLLGSGDILVEPVITATSSADYYRGDKTFQPLNKTAVGLSNVDNTSDVNKPVSTAQQTALDTKVTKTGSTTGSVISFVTPQIYNTFSSPSTSNITDDLTSAQIGVIQKIYHNNGTAPTFPAGWVRLGSTTYTAGALNIIYAEWVSGTRVEYWITQ